jgi:hypothetical protein
VLPAGAAFAGGAEGADRTAGPVDIPPPAEVLPVSAEATSVFFAPQPTKAELNTTAQKQARRYFMGVPHRRNDKKKTIA